MARPDSRHPPAPKSLLPAISGLPKPRPQLADGGQVKGGASGPAFSQAGPGGGAPFNSWQASWPVEAESRPYSRERGGGEGGGPASSGKAPGQYEDAIFTSFAEEALPVTDEDFKDLVNSLST